MENCIKQFAEICEKGYRKGFHEINGGNLSYRLTKDDMVKVKPYISNRMPMERSLGKIYPNLANECFLVTGSGKYFMNAKEFPSETFGLIRISDDGEHYTILWGFDNGAKPTSEFATHLLAHSIKKNISDSYRTVYHAHPTEVIVLSHILPCDDAEFTRRIWNTMTECPIIFNKGIGVVPWMVCGSEDIANASAKKLEEYDVIVWQGHGVFSMAKGLDEAFGEIDLLTKAADIATRLMNEEKILGQKIPVIINREACESLSGPFNFTVKEKFFEGKEIC